MAGHAFFKKEMGPLCSNLINNFMPFAKLPVGSTSSGIDPATQYRPNMQELVLGCGSKES